MLNNLINHVESITLSKSIISAIIITLAIILKSGTSRYFQKKYIQNPPTAKKLIVQSNNLIMTTVVLMVLAVWASTLSGFAISIAAVAGAILLINKELIMCAIGYVLIYSAKPFKIGDFIEIAGMKGRVSDINFVHTVIAEGGTLNQLTGKSVSVPNSKLITEPVRNNTATGRFVIDLMDIIIPINSDLVLAESAAIDAAESVCSPWMEEADKYLAHFETTELIDLPSAKPRVLFGSVNEKAILLQIRFTCEPNNRVKVEQAVFREFWKKFKVTSTLDS